MRFLTFIGVLAIVAAIAAVVFFFGGYYNVAATNKNPAVVDWALEYIRKASIAKHADATPPSSLDDVALVQAGARAFAQRGAPIATAAPASTGPSSPRASSPVHRILPRISCRICGPPNCSGWSRTAST